jgi:hypothetical protein
MDMTDWDDGRTPPVTRPPTLGNLVEQLSEQATRLVRAEIALAKEELAGKAKRSGIGAGLLAFAGVIVFYAVGVLIWSGVIGLSHAWPLWLSALVVGAAMVVLAGILAVVGAKLVQRAATKPDAVDRVKTDISTVRASLKGSTGTTTSEENVL